MAMRLDVILENLHPTRLMDPVRRKLTQALDTFPHRASRITRWPEFQCWFVLLCRHCEAAVLGLKAMPSELNVEADFGRYFHYLQGAFGSSGKAAFETARSGCEGGAEAVARQIATAIGNEYIKHWTEVSVWSYWNSLTPDEKEAAGYEFVTMCGHLYPTEMTESSAARIRFFLPHILMEYPRLQEKLRESVRFSAGG